MPEQLLVVPAETETDGDTTITVPKYRERVDRLGCRPITLGANTVVVTVFVGPTAILDEIESEPDVFSVPDGPGIARAIERVTENAAWSGPPLSSVDELHAFLTP